MKGLSLCQKLGAFCLLLAVCILAVGCGGSPVDALIKDSKAYMADVKAAGTDAEKLKALKTKGEDLKKRYDALTADQKKEFDEKAKKEGIETK